MIYGECRDGALSEVTLELIGEGRRIADKLKEPLMILLTGDDTKSIQKELTQYPLDSIIIKEDILLKNRDNHALATVVVAAVESLKPNIVFFGGTVEGRAVASRAAYTLDTGLAADCTELDINDKGLLVQTKPSFGDNIMAVILCPNHKPQMTTIRPGTFHLPTPGKSKNIPVEKLALVLKESTFLTKHLKAIELEKKGEDISKSSIIIGVGRGIRNKEGMALAYDLANELGGVVGGTRAVTDVDLLAEEYQIGQTGKIIRPKLYIALGISGAIQHVAGITADYFIAVNTDATAPIMGVADLAIEGDIKDIVPQLIRELKTK